MTVYPVDLKVLIIKMLSGLWRRLEKFNRDDVKKKPVELKKEITNGLKENSSGLDDTAEWTVNWKTTVGVIQAEQKEIFKMTV